MNVQSRRERPAKPALTRQGIIDAALRVMNDEGLGKVTMRRVATELDTGHASLYVYVRDAEDLHAQILDALLAPVTETQPGGAQPGGAQPGGAQPGGARPDESRSGGVRSDDTQPDGAWPDGAQPDGGRPEGDWRVRLKALLIAYGAVLHARPEIARMALSTQPSGPHYLRLVEAILALLHEGGADDRAAAWGVDMLLLYPTAIAVEHTGPKPSRHAAGDPATLSATLAGVDPESTPNIARLGTALIDGTPAARADWALDVLLDGILAATPPRSPAPVKTTGDVLPMPSLARYVRVGDGE